MHRKSLRNVLAIAATLSVGTMALTANVVDAKGKAKERPYRARIEALAIGFPCGVYAASGNATHLGQITESGSYCAGEPVGPGLFPLAGEGTQIAANGDSLSFTFEEIVDFNVEPFTAVGTFTITGGTGRFAGASGGGTFATTGTSLEEGLGLSIEYVGTISY